MRIPRISIVTLAFTFTACNKPPAPIPFGKVKAVSEASGNSGENGEPVAGESVPGEEKDSGPGKVSSVTGLPTALSLTTSFPRLTQLQWENSVRDVLLLDAQPKLSSLFPSDPQNTFFANDGNSLTVSDGLWQSYVKAAETMAAKIGDNAALVAKLVPGNAMTLTGDARAAAIITPLATRAFRRPPTTAQLKRLVTIFNAGSKLTGKNDPLAAGLQAVVHMLLQSPNFLYRVELGAEAKDFAPLTAWEVAARLSFAAWNTIPDAELFAAAKSGEILTEDGLAEQARRVMNDPKANDILTYFYSKILGTETYSDVTKKDPSIVKNWPDDMGKTLVTEADLFINEVIIKEKGGLNQLLTAPYAFVNSATAPIYKVAAPSGQNFVKTTLNPNERIGFLTQVGFLARRALDKESNAIRRGVLVADKLLCANVSENVPPVLPKLEAPSGKKTSRDVVDEKTGVGTCGASCHADYINPSGYAFENFDAAGNFRTTDNDQPVNAAAKLTLRTGPISYSGPQDFVRKITASRDLHNCLVQKAVGFLYARAVGTQDSSLLQSMALKSAANIPTRDLFSEILSDNRIKLRDNKGK